MTAPARLTPVAGRRKNQSGEETKQRIIDAALVTVGEEGLIGTSARAIARVGDFNQALVFYHFGSVEGLLLAALQRANERRMDRFRAPLEQVDDFPGLVKIAMELHATRSDPDLMALSAIVAGWPLGSEVGPEVRETLRPWDELLAGALDRALSGSPLGQVVPTGDIAHAISALFLGIEMLSRLDPDDTSTQSLFTALEAMAGLATPLLGVLGQQTDVPDSAL